MFDEIPDTPSDDPPRAEDATPSEDSRWLLGYVAGGPKWVARFVEHESSMGDGIYYKHIVPIETTDANEALAFCRERDAKAILESVDYPYRVILRPEEHIWDSAPVRSDWSLIDSLSARKLADSNEINSLRAQLGSLTGALEEARREVEENEAACLEVIDERDHREDQITAIYYALGGDAEWSSLHDLGDDAIGLAGQILAALKRARAAARPPETPE